MFEIDSVTESTDSELKWIESESLDLVKQSVNGTTGSVLLAIFVLFTLLYSSTKNSLWWTWLILHGLIFITRVIYFFVFYKNSKIKLTNRNTFISIVFLIGLVWGSSVYLLLNKEQIQVDAICLCLILTYGIGTTFNLSRHLQSLNVFLYGYGAGLIGSLLTSYSLYNNGNLLENALILFTTILYLFVLLRFGKIFSLTHTNAMRLQYRNQRLIESLTIEKQAALNAVDVKNRFLAGATHDMRQPVLALDLYTDMLISTPNALPTILPKISLATKSVISLFDALFDLARMSMNQLKPEKLHFNMNDMIVDLNQQFQPIAAAKGLKLRVRHSKQRYEIFDDPILIRRIVSNLLSNAVKYTDNGGIFLAYRHDKLRGIRVEVWDTGVGISPLMQKAVFDEFYKNPENVGTSDGFGLGLSLVSQMSTLLGHKVLMRSRRGRGTVVSIRLADSVYVS
jgi:signal transduction histidine kinase